MFTETAVTNCQIILKLRQDVFKSIQKFVCDAYIATEIIVLDAVRLQLFFKTYSVSDVNEEFNRENVKYFDASSLPPCKAERLQQFWRANYIASFRNNAYIKQLNISSPEIMDGG